MPTRQPYMSQAQLERIEKTPPKYRTRRYTEQGPLYKPDFGQTSVRSMTRRMAEQLENTHLSEEGVQAFSAWLRRLIWNESMWLATATYSFREILLDHLKEVFYEYPGLTRDKQLIEDALFVELRRLSDEYNFGYSSSQRTQRQRHLSSVSDPFRTHVAS